MAFLVEHVDPHARSQEQNIQATSAQTKPRRSSTMNLFRRNSHNIPDSTSVSSAPTRSPSTTDTDRKSSFSNLSSRFRRKKTKSPVEFDRPDDDAAAQLGHLFLSLPSEILVQIVCYLSLPDIYTLRLTSHTISSILNDNASVIYRKFASAVLPEHVVPYALSLYPPCPTANNLRDLLCILHRQRRIDKVIYHTLSYVRMRSYLMRSGILGLMSPPSPGRQILEECLQQPTWTAYHFLERYRDIVVDQHDQQHSTQGLGRFWDCRTCESKAKDLVNSYPSVMVLPTFHHLQLLMSHFETATRPPASSGPLGRKAGSKNVNNEEDLGIFFLLGGIEELSNISIMQGSYGRRMGVIGDFNVRIRTAVDINECNIRTASPTTVKRSLWAVNDQMQSENSPTLIVPAMPRRESKDITKSLAPAYSALTQDHLDRLPRLQDFLLPMWQDRIERENLHMNNGQTRDLSSPFDWVQRVLFGMQQADQAESAAASDTNNAATSTAVAATTHQTPNNGSETNNSVAPTALFMSHPPSGLVPVFGASPV